MRADVEAIMADDGETVTITTRTGPQSVLGFWRDRGFADTTDLGPHFTLATNDEPSQLETRNTVSRAGDPDVYTITNIQRTAAGQLRLVLQANH